MAKWKTDARLWEEYAVAREKYGKSSKEAKTRRWILKEIDEWNKPLEPLQFLSKVKVGKEERREILMIAKERSAAIYEEKKRYRLLPEQNIPQFRGFSVNWELYRPYDENYNDYDCRTERAIIWHKMTAEEEYSFHAQFEIEFYDPYCDGRDCTGAPFTSWMKFLRCTDRTIVLHRINYDV